MVYDPYKAIRQALAGPAQVAPNAYTQQAAQGSQAVNPLAAKQAVSNSKHYANIMNQPARHWAQALSKAAAGAMSGIEDSRAREQGRLAQQQAERDRQASAARAQQNAQMRRQQELEDEQRKFERQKELISFKAQNRAPAGPTYRNVGGTLLQVGPDGQTQELYRAPLSPEDQLLQQLMGGGQQPPAGPAPAQGLQPQSAPQGPMTVPQTNVQQISNAGQQPIVQAEQQQDPNLIRVTDGQGSGQQPQQGGMIEIPGLRPMTREQAERAATAFALTGKDEMADMIRSRLDGKTEETIDPNKVATNELQKQLINSTNGMARIQKVMSLYKPEYQTIEGMFKNWGAGWYERAMGPGSLSPETKELVEGYTRFKTEALNNINLYIKEITGAQMSEAEANRLRSAVADPGDSVWTQMSPSQFESAIKQDMERVRQAHMRSHYLLRKGWTPVYKNKKDDAGNITRQLQGWRDQNGAIGSMPGLNKMSDIYNERANELLNLYNGDKQRALQQVNQEFGI